MDSSVKVALKKLKSENYTKEFQQEVAVLLKLNHPNIVRFYGMHMAQNEMYMVFEFLSEGSIDKLLHSKKKEITQYGMTNVPRQAF